MRVVVYIGVMDPNSQFSPPHSYLDDPRFQLTFEAAHSFILALFTARRRVCRELAPYYVRLLLASYPSLLNEAQFEHAFGTTIDTLSDKDDAAAWWALTQLSEEIDQSRLHLAGVRSEEVPSASTPSAPPTNALVTSAATATGLPKPPPPTRAEVLQHLELTYVSQLANINLALLRSTLARVRALINEAARLGDDEKRMALCERTFATLALLDASTREEGLAWWTNHRKEFGV